MLNIYTILCLDREGNVPDLCHNFSMERVGNLGKRFSNNVWIIITKILLYIAKAMSAV